MNWGNWSSAEKCELRPITTVVTTSWVPSDIQVNWTMNERGHDEEAQSDYIFAKNTSTNWNTIDVSQGSTRRQIFDWACEIWMDCNGGDPSKRAAVLGARTSKKLRCVGSTRFVHPQLCIVPWQRYGMSKPLRGRVCDTGSFACHIAQWYRVTITMIQGDNWVANCVSALEQEGWGWTHLF